MLKIRQIGLITTAFALAFFCSSTLLAVNTDGPSFITGTKGPVPRDRIRVTRTCDIGPLVMNVATCRLDSACPEMGRLQNGQSQDFIIDDGNSYSVKGFNFTSGTPFTPCRANRGDEVVISKARSGAFGAYSCFCETKNK